ncbi:MFS transporter [Paenibacillus sp. 481]|uniref:MFS transporter n=1 Tax=Paenibacillus sp. 481 TaxID=2835869 RepID=UPI003FA78222
MRFVNQAMEDWSKWNRNIRLFFLANILYQFGSGIFSVLYNLYIQSLGFAPTMNGTLISLQSLTTALTFIPIGFIGDRTSRKHILIIGALLSGVGLLGRSFAETESSLQLFALFTGVFAAFFQVTAIPFLSNNSPKDQWLRMFSLHFSAVLAAQVLGNMSGGFLSDILQHIGFERSYSLQMILVLGSIATFAAIIPLLFITEQQKQSAIAEPEVNESKAIRPQHEWGMIARFTFAQLLIGFGSGLVIPYLNLYFTDRFDTSLSAVGVLISLGQIMTIFSMLIGPSLVQRFGEVKSVVTLQLMSLPFLILTGFTNVFFVAAIGFLFRQALMNAANPITSTILVENISNSKRGFANSLNQSVFMFGWASMGPVQSYFVTTYGSYWGYAFTFSITGLLYVTAATYFYFTFRNRVQKAH